MTMMLDVVPMLLLALPGAIGVLTNIYGAALSHLQVPIGF